VDDDKRISKEKLQFLDTLSLEIRILTPAQAKWERVRKVWEQRIKGGLPKKLLADQAENIEAKLEDEDVAGVLIDGFEQEMDLLWEKWLPVLKKVVVPLNKLLERAKGLPCEEAVQDAWDRLNELRQDWNVEGVLEFGLVAIEKLKSTVLEQDEVMGPVRELLKKAHSLPCMALLGEPVERLLLLCKAGKLEQASGLAGAIVRKFGDLVEQQDRVFVKFVLPAEILLDTASGLPCAEKLQSAVDELHLAWKDGAMEAVTKIGTQILDDFQELVHVQLIEQAQSEGTKKSSNQTTSLSEGTELLDIVAMQVSSDSLPKAQKLFKNKSCKAGRDHCIVLIDALTVECLYRPRFEHAFVRHDYQNHGKNDDFCNYQVQLGGSEWSFQTTADTSVTTVVLDLRLLDDPRGLEFILAKVKQAHVMSLKGATKVIVTYADEAGKRFAEKHR
jgi:hypothetical protein